MLKVTVLGYRPVMDQVVEALQHSGVLQIDATAYELPTEEVHSDDPRIRALDEQVAEAHFVRDFLSHYHVNEQPLAAFVTEKFHLSREDYLTLHFDQRVRALYEECLTISDHLGHNERESERLAQLIKDLEPWGPLRYQIREWRGTDTTVLFAGTVPSAEGPEIRQALRDEVAEVSVDELGPVGENQAWVVIAHCSVASQVRSVLAARSFTEVSFPGLSDYPAEEVARAREQLSDVVTVTQGLRERAQSLADAHFHQAVALVQAIDSQRDLLTVRREFARTERAFAITGWIVADRADELETRSGCVPSKCSRTCTGGLPTMSSTQHRSLRRSSSSSSASVLGTWATGLCSSVARGSSRHGSM